MVCTEFAQNDIHITVRKCARYACGLFALLFILSAPLSTVDSWSRARPCTRTNWTIAHESFSTVSRYVLSGPNEPLFAERTLWCHEFKVRIYQSALHTHTNAHSCASPPLQNTVCITAWDLLLLCGRLIFPREPFGLLSAAQTFWHRGHEVRTSARVCPPHHPQLTLTGKTAETKLFVCKSCQQKNTFFTRTFILT